MHSIAAHNAEAENRPLHGVEARNGRCGLGGVFGQQKLSECVSRVAVVQHGGIHAGTSNF